MHDLALEDIIVLVTQHYNAKLTVQYTVLSMNVYSIHVY